MPSSTFRFYNAYPDALHESRINPTTDVIKIALSNTAQNPAHAAYSDLSGTLVALTNLTTGHDTLGTVTSTHSTNTTTIDATDHTLTADGGSVGEFQYIIFYSDTASNKDLIGWHDYGSGLTLADGESLSIPFPSGIYTTTFTNP